MLSGPDRKPLLVVAAAILATFGLPVILGYSLLPQHVMPSVFPSGLTGNPPAGPGLMTIDPIAASQMLPWDRLVGHAMRAGQWPAWNPYSLTGLPLAANIQSAVFFPMQFLQDLTPSVLWSVFYVARLLTAGLFSYLFLRRIGVREWASASGAIFYALSGTMVLWFRLEPVFNSTVALAIALYGVERAHGEPTWRNLAVGAAAFACLVVSGQPEVTALNAMFLGMYSILRVWQTRSMSALLVYPAGVLIAAPFVLPVVQYVLRAGAAKRETFGTIALSPAVAVLQVVPYLLGDVHRHVNVESEALFSWIFIGGYLGVTALYLAIVAIWSAGGDRLRSVGRFAALVLLVVLMKVYGVPPVQWIGDLPLFTQFFFTRYTGAVIAIAVAILVAIGAQRFGEAEDPRLHLRALALTFTILLFLLVPVVRLLPVARGALSWPSLGPLLTVVGVALGLSLARMPREAGARTIAVGAVVAVELMVLARPVLAGLPRAQDLFQDPPFVSFLRDRQSREGMGRVYALDGFLYGNYAAAFGVSALNVCEGLIPRNIREFASRYLDPGMNPAFFDGASPFRTSGSAREALRSQRKYYDFAGVRYLMASPRAGALLESTPRPFPRNRPNAAVGLGPGERVSAKLRLDRDQLSGVKVLMATYGRRNGGVIVLRVRDASGRLVAGSQREAAALDDNEYAEFRFGAIAPKAGEEVTLEWEYIGAPPSDAVAFWCETESRTGYELQGSAHHIDVLPYIVQQSDAGWVQIYDKEARIWENPSAFPRAFVVPRVRVAPTREDALDLVGRIDLRQEAVVVEEPKLKLRPTTNESGPPGGAVAGRSSGAVSIKEMSPSRVVLSIVQPASGLLVLTDTYYPGWIATVDGAPRDIYETDAAFRGVTIGRSDREVVFEYHPWTRR